MVNQKGGPFIAEINTMPNIKTPYLADKYSEQLELYLNKNC